MFANFCENYLNFPKPNKLFIVQCIISFASVALSRRSTMQILDHGGVPAARLPKRRDSRKILLREAWISRLTLRQISPCVLDCIAALTW